MGRGSLNGSPAAWKPAAIPPQEFTTLPGCSLQAGPPAHGVSLDAPQPLTKLPALLCPVLGTDPPPAGAVTPDHPAPSLKAHRPCPGVPIVPSSAPQHRLPTCQLPPRCFPRRQTMVFPGSTNHPDFCSEALSSSVRAWTGASAVPHSGLLGIRPSAGGLFSTGVPPVPVFWQTGSLQSQVTQSASPSADTCGDGSPDTSHPAQALCPQSSPRSFSCSSGAPAVLHSWGF